MRLSKWLTPIIAFATIVPTAVSLTSCNEKEDDDDSIVLDLQSTFYHGNFVCLTTSAKLDLLPYTPYTFKIDCSIFDESVDITDTSWVFLCADNLDDPQLGAKINYESVQVFKNGIELTKVQTEPQPGEIAFDPDTTDLQGAKNDWSKTDQFEIHLQFDNDEQLFYPIMYIFG